MYIHNKLQEMILQPYQNSPCSKKLQRLNATILSLILLILPVFSLHSQDRVLIPELDTLEIEEVVVSGTRIEVARKNIPITVSVVSREQIELTNETAVLPVLSYRVPGMFVTERGVTGFGIGSGSAGQISMRGVGGTAPNTQVLVLIDGSPQYQGIFAHPFPDAYVSSDVEKVEVIRGPASILYGSNAMAGAINIITRQQATDGFSLNGRVSYGSFNTQKYMASGGFRDGRFSVFASVNRESTEGHRESSDFNITNGYIKTGYELSDNFRLSADFSLADINSEDPGSIYNPSLFGIDILRGKASLSLHNQFERTEGGLIAFYNYGDHDFSDGWISSDYHAGVSLFQGLQLFSGNRVTVGVDYKNTGGIANSGMAANQWNDVTDIAGYTYMQQTLFERLVLSAGIRLENNSLFGTETVPQTGFAYHATDNITVKGSLSKGFRSPTIMELYLFAPNPGLSPERMMNYELGISRYCPDRRIRAELTLYLIEGDNVIEVRPNDNPPPPMMRQNVGSFSNKGFEVEVSWMATSNLNFSSNYSFLDLDRPRLASPRHQFYLEGTYNLNKIRMNLAMQQISGLYNFTGEPEPLQENYTLINLMFSYRFSGNLEIFASGKNLLNQDYTINYGYPMPGATFFTGINVNLN
jgi:outer membrane receptor protein involved in Fe transport